MYGELPRQLTTEFSHRISELHSHELSGDVRRMAERSLLNVIGTAIGASNHEAVDLIISLGKRHGGAATTSLPGRHESLDALAAATAIGLAAHLDDFDDTHLSTVIHPGAATMGAVLATAAMRGSSGRAALSAFAWGCEAQLRVGLAMSPEHYDDGWHITGTCAPIGSAIAAGLLADFSGEQLTNAVGIAASQTLGIREAFGTMTKPFHPGKGAANGLLAVRLTERGVTGPRDVLEDPRGYFTVLSPHGARAESVLEDLGTRWELLDNTFKPYPCGIVSHPAIDAAVAISPRVPESEHVIAVRATVHPLVPELTGNLQPKDGLEARFSTAHGIAAGLADGNVGLPQYTDARVTAADTTRLRGLIEFVVDQSMSRDAAAISLELADGEIVSEHVEHARGSLARPLSDSELQDKVTGLIEPVLPGGSQQVIDAVNGLYDAPDLGALAAATHPEGV